MNHINGKTVLSLGVAALLVILLASFFSGQRKPTEEMVASGGYAFPLLKQHVDELTSLLILGAEDKPLVSFARSDRGWSIREKAGYPADSGKLRELILKLADARLLEKKTANVLRFRDLAVEDTQSKDAKGVKLVLEGLHGSEALIVGNFNTKANGSFVRRPGNPQSWLAKGNLSIDRDPVHWLDTAIVDIGSERISEVVLTGPGDQTLRIYKESPGDADFKLSDATAGKPLTPSSAANGLASTLSDLHLQDVLPLGEAKQPEDTQLRTASYRSFDGVKVDIIAWKDGDKYYGRFTAVLEQARAEAHVQENQAKAKAEFERQRQANPQIAPPPEVADAVKDREQRLAALASEVATLTQRFKGWVYQVPAYKFEDLNKSMDDLLTPAPSD